MTNLAPSRSWSWRIRLVVATSALASIVMIGRIVVVTQSAEARADVTVTILYSFKGGTDGQYPDGDMVRDAAGNLYGTTSFGGAFDYGTVFKLSR